MQMIEMKYSQDKMTQFGVNSKDIICCEYTRIRKGYQSTNNFNWHATLAIMITSDERTLSVYTDYSHKHIN